MRSFEIQLMDALKKAGYLLPETLEEVQEFEKFALDKKNCPPMPAELNDPSNILRKGYSKPVPYETSLNDEIGEDLLAMAARFGNQIPEHIREKMDNDRNAQEEE